MEGNQTQCPKCQAQVSMDQYQPEVVNSERLSMISIAHELGLDCPSCGEYLIPQIQTARLEVILAVHPRPARAMRIVAPTILRDQMLQGIKLQ